MMFSRPAILALAAFSVLGPLAGCGDFAWFRRKLPPEPKPAKAEPVDPVLADTIGTRTLLGNAEALLLRGFGVVVGLGEDGSSDCPTTIRKYLIEYLQKQFSLEQRDNKQPLDLTPAKLIDSRDTAVVVVYGRVPPGAPRGTRFDVVVEALGNQTRSLEGGVLIPTEMRVFDVSASGTGIVAGRTLAMARGPVLTNPFVPQDGGARRDLRRGRVLGGGRTTIERKLRVLLEEPSYSMARRIERSLNERFGQSPPTALAMSMGYLEVRTPAPYARAPERFLALLPRLYTENSPSFYERKLAELSRLISPDPCRLAQLSLIWEGIGPATLPTIRPLYEHPDPLIRFHAAQAGLRLHDASALAAMRAIASDRSHPYRLLAIGELAAAGLRGATPTLVALLDDPDAQVRIAAYEALREYGHPAIRSERYVSIVDPSQTSLIFEQVRSAARPLIYIRRTSEPRIAVFGSGVPVVPPVFYAHHKDWVILSGQAGDGRLTLISRNRPGLRFATPKQIPPRVDALIHALAALPALDEQGRPEGLALPYSTVVEVLDALCKQKAIPAELVVEQPVVIELPRRRPERPEAEETPPLPASEPQPAPEPADESPRP